VRGSSTSIGQRLARGPIHGYALLAVRSIRSQRLGRRNRQRRTSSERAQVFRELL
jgi:hypothetical protein